MFYVFKGQNASTGEPNKITGRYSFYGQVYCFDTKKEAMEFMDNFESPYVGHICVMGDKRKMREFCLGMTIESFNDYLNYTLPIHKNIYGQWE